MANDTMEDDTKNVLAQFKSDSGELVGSPFDIPINVTKDQLQHICTALLQPDENVPYSFFVGETEVRGTLAEAALAAEAGTERLVEIVYQPQAVFRVRAITRCTSTLEGHGEPILAVHFSPDGQYLASGSGDTTVRLWDLTTETPQHTCKAHTSWTLVIGWSPDGRLVASADKTGAVCVWDGESGKQRGKTLKGHKMWVTSLAWEPLHSNPECRRLATASKDTTVRIWDLVAGHTTLTLSGHTQSVTCVRWGGQGLIYTGAQDRTVKVWRATDGVLCRTLQGHAHWVNTLALSTDYVCRTGAFDPKDASIVHHDRKLSSEELRERAAKRYAEAVQVMGGDELMISGSDDFTMFLWRPALDKKPVTRMTGHQQLINDVKYSPDGRLIASASFDKSIKLWDGRTGKFLSSLRGHVQAVYQVAWSGDGRLLVSGSADSTLKVWDVSLRKLLLDLPGHADEVYAVDWSPDGQRVASGGKDKVLKIWRN